MTMSATQSNEIPANASPEARALIHRLDDGLNQMIDRYEALQAVNKALEAELVLTKSQLKAMIEGNVGEGVLHELALDPNTEPELKAKVGIALFQTEKPKLSAVMTTAAPVKLFDILEARRAQGKVIEQAPGPQDAA
jgi:hypothetical protein